MVTNWTLEEKILDLNKQYSKYVLNIPFKESFKIIKEPSGLITLYKDNRRWIYFYDMIEIITEIDILFKSIYVYLKNEY